MYIYVNSGYTGLVFEFSLSMLRELKEAYVDVIKILENYHQLEQ